MLLQAIHQRNARPLQQRRTPVNNTRNHSQEKIIALFLRGGMTVWRERVFCYCLVGRRLGKIFISPFSPLFLASSLTSSSIRLISSLVFLKKNSLS